MLRSVRAYRALGSAFLGVLLFVACTANTPAQRAHAAQPDKDVAVTIYSSADPMNFDPQLFIAQQRRGYNPQSASQVPGFGVIRDTRTIDLNEGVNHVRFTDVAQFIDPTTVSLADLTAQGDAVVQVVEQKFQFDLVSPQKLLDKYIDQRITVNLNLGDGQREVVEGVLLSSSQNKLVLNTDTGLRIVAAHSDLQLGPLPDGLITKPTLQWQLHAPADGQRTVRTAYQTDGITWRSDYNLVLNHNDTRADLGAWVTIMNLTGASYEDAKLKLIAGDVQRFKRAQHQMSSRRSGRELAAMASTDAAGFEEKSFFEYHLYTLPRRTTIDQNSTQQIALFPTVRDFGVEKVLVYYGLPQAGHWFFPSPRTDRDLGQQSNKKVDVYIRFDNRKENKLGIPLPKGKIRVYKLDDEGTADATKHPGAGAGALEFIGEDLIDHTAKNEQVLIKIGKAFDVTGERVQTDFKVDVRAHWMTETIRIKVSNAKNKPQKVIVRENLYRWVNWTLVNKSHEYKKIDSRTIHFEIEVPAESESAVEYTVRYTW